MNNTAHSNRERFVYDLRCVKSNQYNLAKRLEKKARTKAFIVNFLTVLSLIVSGYLLGDVNAISASFEEWLALLLFSLSIFVLWMSLDDPAHTLDGNSKSAYRMANELNSLYRNLDYGLIELEDAVRIYAELLKKIEVNHDDVDRKKTLYDDRKKYPEKAIGINYINSVALYVIRSYSPALTASAFCIMAFTLNSLLLSP